MQVSQDATPKKSYFMEKHQLFKELLRLVSDLMQNKPFAPSQKLSFTRRGFVFIFLKLGTPH